MRVVAPRIGTGERYATEVVELWSGLSRTLSRLESLAAEPERFDETELSDRLRRLQYELHLAAEQAFGLAPPEGSESAHAELATALAAARDATGQVVQAVDEYGVDAADRLVHQWRGALFRVRLARMSLATAPPAAEEVEPEDDPKPSGAIAAAALAVAGASVFVAGAALELWPLWVAGMAAFAASFLVFRT
jgi:hypothetical protein